MKTKIKKERKEILRLSIMVIISLILIIVLSIKLYEGFVPLNTFCENECRDPHNSPEECGRFLRLPNCHDNEAPNTTIFGLENKNKLRWCYDLDGGKCGWQGIRYFYPLLFIFLFLFFGSLIIFSCISIIHSLRIIKSEQKKLK